jgi:hypothetical protein
MTTQTAYNRLYQSLRATNVLSDEYTSHIMAAAGKIAEEAAKAGRAEQRTADLRALDGLIDPDGYDAETVREVLRRLGVR